VRNGSCRLPPCRGYHWRRVEAGGGRVEVWKRSHHSSEIAGEHVGAEMEATPHPGDKHEADFSYVSQRSSTWQAEGTATWRTLVLGPRASGPRAPATALSRRSAPASALIDRRGQPGEWESANERATPRPPHSQRASDKPVPRGHKVCQNPRAEHEHTGASIGCALQINTQL
jgi:hypothetical protein